MVALVFATPFVKAQKAKVIISQPECNILYKDYDNKIIVTSGLGKITNLQALGATIFPQSINGEKGFVVRPSGIHSCNLVATIKDDNGIEFKDTSVFIVRQFPSPIITTSTVSKASGARINVALPPDSFMAGIDFEVKGMELLAIKDGAIDGNIIKPTQLAKLKIGETFGIIVFAKNNYSGQMITIHGSLKVTN